MISRLLQSDFNSLSTVLRVVIMVNSTVNDNDDNDFDVVDVDAAGDDVVMMTSALN